MDSLAHRGKAGHEGYLTDQVASLPETLRRDGAYSTAMAGKWNLGIEREHFPDRRGYDRSFALLAPAANHFAREPEIAPSDDAKLPRFAQMNVAALHAEDGCYVDNDQLPSEYYSSDYYADKLLDYLNDRPKDKPFFAHLSFSAPHWPLQAPANEIRQYYGVYDEGPKTLREQRLEGLQKLGLVPPDTKAHPIVAPEVPKWGALTPEQRAKSARTMETYAAMVSRLDYNVGRLLSWLKYHKLYANTQILFLSTSGPAGASPNLDARTGPEVQRYIAKYHDNALANLGAETSFPFYGARWAQASSPFRLYAGVPTEGGTRVPCILKPPGPLPFRKPLCHSFATIADLAPTMAQQAGVAFPNAAETGSHFLHGRSWLPYLLAQTPFPHPASHASGWELAGSGALRKGGWKIVSLDAPHGAGDWQLFHLAEDVGESVDLARKRPEKLEELVKEFLRYREEVGVVGLGAQVRGLKGEMTDPRTWVKFETSWGVMRREEGRRFKRLESAGLDGGGGGGGGDEESEDEFQDLDDDAVEMV